MERHASALVIIGTSRILCPKSSPISAPAHIHISRLLQISGRKPSANRRRHFLSIHAAFLKTCHRVGQTKPTPLVLHYEAGGYNCLHQDLYGEIAFPLQIVFYSGSRGANWQGGDSS